MILFFVYKIYVKIVYSILFIIKINFIIYYFIKDISFHFLKKNYIKDIKINLLIIFLYFYLNFYI